MTEQELLNAEYTGPWLASALSFFSAKDDNPALKCACRDGIHSLIKLTSEDIQHQALLHLVLKWFVDSDKKSYPKIKDYMEKHRFDENADELIRYYKSVMDWAYDLSGDTYHKQMCGMNWGFIYNKYRFFIYDSRVMQMAVAGLVADKDVLNKAGIFSFIFDADKKHLRLRTFSNSVKKQVYQKQGGICPYCKNTENKNKVWAFEEMTANTIMPWPHNDGIVPENCEMLCPNHTRE